MEKIKRIFKTKSAKILAVLFISSLLALSFAPAINADGPIFNGLPGDQKLIRGANSTQNPGSTEWSDPVSGKSGDAVAVLLYYHNIVEGSTAKNTRLSVALPEGEKTTQILKAKLWAANADAVKDNLTINSNQTVSVEYIPGTTKWFPNRQGDPTGEGELLPDGITTPEGVSIGGIKGCWQFAGYVIFQVRLMHTPTPPPTKPDIAIEKFVSNTSLGSGIYNWQEEVEANINEEVAFNLTFNNEGTAPAQNVVISDVLPAGLTYVNGSAVLSRSTGQSVISNELFNAGINIGTLGKGESAYITFKAKVKNYGTLINTGRITADGGLFDEDQARVIVKKPVILNPHLTIEKLVRNVSFNESIFVKENSAFEGDIVEYQIVIRSDGETSAKNLSLRDVLPIPVSYVPGSISIALPSGQVINSVELFNQDMPLGDLAPGEVIIATFKAKVNGEIACGSKFENKAIATAQGNLRADSFAYTNVVCKKVIPTPAPTPKVKGISTLTPTGTPIEALAAVGLILMLVGSAIIVYKYKI